MFRYTESKLAKDVIRIFREIDDSLTGQFNPDRQNIQFYDKAGDEKGGRVFLGNLYAQAKQLGFIERRRWLRAVIAEMSEDLLLNADELLASLKLRVRTRFEVGLRNRIATVRGSDVEYSLSQAGELFLELVSDRENTVSLVGSTQLANAGITAEEANRNARAALARVTGPDQWNQVEPGIWVSTYADDYDFARLVALAADARLPFEAVPIVYAPSHSTCVTTDRVDKETLNRVVAVGNELSNDQRQLSQLLWTRNPAGDWQEFRPMDDTPAAAVVAMQRLAETNSQYDEQKYYLEAVLEDREEDSFVASFMIYEDDAGPFTVCAYTFDIPSYLPETDRVAILDPRASDNGGSGMMSWQDFAAAVGPETLVRMPGEDPPRFKLMAALSPEQKSALRTLAAPISRD